MGSNCRDSQRPLKGAKAPLRPSASIGERRPPLVAQQQQPPISDDNSCQPSSPATGNVSASEDAKPTPIDSGTLERNSTPTEAIQATASLLAPRCCLPIDWSAPVYLHTVGSPRLLRLRRPLPYFFRPSQIKRALAEEQFVLARIMINVVKVFREFSICPAAIKLSLSWEDALNRSASVVPIASESINGAADGTISTLPAAISPSSPSHPRETLAGAAFGTSCTESPQTPKLAVDLQLDHHRTIRTPSDDDSDTQRLQEEIERVIRRTPAIQKVTPPDRGELIRKASTAIRDARLSLFESPAKKGSATTGKSLEPEPSTGLESGSAYLYALVTPTKRMREMLETDAAISPVRRSKRILERGQLPNSQPLFSTLDEIPDLAQRGFLPNSAINIAQLPHKRDPSSLLLLPPPPDSPARPNKLSKPDHQP